MVTHAQNGSGRYLYAIVAGSEGRTYGFPGIDGGAVYTMPVDRVMAVVSDIANEKIRPERRHLATHQEVLKHLMKESTPLPMSFGAIADGPEAIRTLLTLNQVAFLEQLQRVQGKVEMGLKVVWDVPNIFEYFVGTHAELRAARDEAFRGGREPSRDAKIELGRLFDRMLTHDRTVHTQKVTNALRHRCSEITENRVRNELEVMNLACLIRRDGQEEFQQGVFDAAALFDNNYSFDSNGPWPPYNFVETNLQLGDR